MTGYEDRSRGGWKGLVLPRALVGLIPRENDAPTQARPLGAPMRGVPRRVRLTHGQPSGSSGHLGLCSLGRASRAPTTTGTLAGAPSLPVLLQFLRCPTLQAKQKRRKRTAYCASTQQAVKDDPTAGGPCRIKQGGGA